MEIHIQKDKHTKLVDPENAKLAHGDDYRVSWHNSNNDIAEINIPQASWEATFTEDYPGVIRVSGNGGTSPTYTLQRKPPRIDGKYNYTVSAGDEIDTNCFLNTSD